MELKTKYQYTYLIYPFYIEGEKYKNCICNMLKSKNCKLEIFRKEHDIGLYNFFLPKVRNYYFEMERFDESAIKKLDEIDLETRAAILAQNSVVFFKYCIDYKTKKTEPNKIAFDIVNAEIICTKTGIGFLVIKTVLTNTSKFSDMVDFKYKLDKYKFVDMLESMEDNVLMDKYSVNECKKLIEEVFKLIGNELSYKHLDLVDSKVYQYSYVCLDSESWNNNSDLELIKNDFEKISTFNKYDVKKIDEKRIMKIEKYNPSKYIKYVFNENGTVLLTSAVNIDNYTKLSYAYENEYLYSYLYTLYKYLMIEKISAQMNIKGKYRKIKEEVYKFNNEIWINEITADRRAIKVIDRWERILNLENKYNNLKFKYDKIRKHKKSEKNFMPRIAVAVVSLFGIILGYSSAIAILGL